MNISLKQIVSCPYCHSLDVIPYSPRPFILAGVGGLLGSVLMVALTLSGKSKSKSAIVGSAVFGALTGVSIGISIEPPENTPTLGSRYFCRHCFRTFTYFDHAVS
jgi:hypothetical protein